MLEHIAALEKQKLFLETIKGLRDQTTEAVLGADAATRLRLAQQGLSKEQLASVAAMQGLAKRMQDARVFAIN